jgi:hypothetical protein
LLIGGLLLAGRRLERWVLLLYLVWCTARKPIYWVVRWKA